jgi:superfamily II DNA helicase RecQ
MPHTPLRCPDPESLTLTLANKLKFSLRHGQIEAIRSLAVNQLDLILIAPTGWGKSAVFQAIPALRGGICLMIMPLNLLEEDQVSWWRGIGRIIGKAEN